MNIVPVLVAALIPMVLGFIWYHPKVLGTIWMKESGMTEEKIQQGNMAVKLGLSFLFAFLLSFVLSSLSVHDAFVQGATYYEEKANDGELSAESAAWQDYYKTQLAPSNYVFAHGVVHGLFLIGLLIIMPVFATNAIFEGKSFKYVAVNVTYWLLCVTFMSGLLAVWR